MPDLKFVLQQIKNTKWWVESAPGSVFLFDYIMKTFVAAKKIVGYPTLKQIVYISRDNISFEIASSAEKRKNFEKIYRHELKKPGYFLKILQPWSRLRRRLLRLNKIAVEKTAKMENADLIKFARIFLQIGFDSVVYGAFIECVDPFTESWPKIFQKKYKIKDENLSTVVLVLSAPRTRSFLTQEKLDFLNLCLTKLTLKQYLQKWFWIQTNYQQSTDITPAKLRGHIKKELHKVGPEKIKKIINKTIHQERQLVKDKQDLIHQLKLEKTDRVLFTLLEKFAAYIDLRKESMLRHTYARDKFLYILAQRFPYSLAEFRSMRDDEVLHILRGKKVDLKKISQRHKISVMYYTPESETEFSGTDAEKIYRAFMHTFSSGAIKGVVASAPVKKLTGRVSVVMDVNRENFQSGTILVTSMTRPEFMPLMRRAKAVVTDEGGLTCHAAIVSRELGIPCIISTKNATKILKNGDQIEMDLSTGLIQIRK